MWKYNYSDELYHYGVKGMKWGVRRYLNKDGSLTNAGKKKYDKMSDNKLEKTLRKQVRKRRAELHGGANRWMSHLSIGENSEQAIGRFREANRAHLNSDDYKKARKQLEVLDRKAESGKISIKDYDSQYEKIRKQVYDPKLDTSVTFNNGRKYVKEYVNGHGKDITIGYLQDLGYNKQVAEEFVKRIIKSDRKTID